jgi:hypothetical protein
MISEKQFDQNKLARVPTNFDKRASLTRVSQNATVLKTFFN